MTDKELITALRKACQDCNPTPCCEYELLGSEAADRIERLQSENTRLKAERDKAVEDMRRCRRNKCDYCYYSNKNQNTPCRDCQSPISNCGDRWKWRGLEESE